MDTCKQCDTTYSSESFIKQVRVCNYFLSKHHINQQHRQGTGKGNNTYRENDAGQATTPEYRQKLYRNELRDYDIKRAQRSQTRII